MIELQGELFALGVEPFLAAALVPASTGGRQAGLGTFADQVALELGERAEQVKHEAATDRRRVDAFLASGAKAERTGLTALLATLRRGDTVVIWRLDRLGRSLKDLIYLVERLDAAGVGLRSVSSNKRSHPACVSASRCRSRCWSSVDTRA